MARTGLKSLVVLAFCASLATPPIQAAGSSAPKKKGDFGALYYGEDEGQVDTYSPEQGDYQQTGSMQQDQGKPSGGPSESTAKPGVPTAAPTLPSAPTPQPTVTQPQPQSAAPAAVRPPAVNDSVAASPQAQPQAAPAHPIPWPGPRRPPAAPAKPAAGPEGGAKPEQVVVQGEKLKDAPGPQNARMYSLWAGLSTPLLLPSSNVKTLSPDKAKDLGRIDYERHILGDRSAPPREAAAAPVGGPAQGAAAAPAVSPALAGSDKGVYIVLELDVAKTPGKYEEAVSRVTAASGLRVDERFPPSFMDPARTHVLVHGWLLPERFSQVMTSEGVSRLEIEHSAVPAPPDSGGTELLLGIRIPEGVSPNLALRDAVLRLAANAHFELQGMIGYQAIPKTNEIVMIVSGRVPVREMGKVMADPAVVKVAPRPSADAVPEPAGKQARMADRILPPMVAKHPAFLLTLILVTLYLLNSPTSRRRR